MGASEVNTDEGADPDEGETKKKRKKKKGIVQKVVKNLTCCSAPLAASCDAPEPPYEPRIAMGPLTLSEFIDTLEPYDPSIHGWRGQEPRAGWKGLPSPKIHPKEDHRPSKTTFV
ncbi:hypothetical protein GE061_018715 [Apolygus lucorum]|uniref:Uncharacterized protein n=1 Tax=Apolygus lucorum TaxID=248454 RepID=A0A6A4JR79_APOLU|nr:hypothetical protein GE061_018715 [Apolygus lucorum]